MRNLEAGWMAAMRAGDYTGAWAVNDEVLAARDPAGRDDPSKPYHQRWVWDGRPFERRHVLVRCYHGLGDTLQFARYLPVLRRRVASLTVEVQAELVPLLATMPGPDLLVPFVRDQPMPLSECDLEIMELPHALRLPPEAVPPARLHVMADGPRRLGLCWRCGGWGSGRDVPEHLMAPLAKGAVSLQLGPTDLPVLNPRGCPPAVADTARLVAAAPLVITVDTMVAHLAASLGRPTWLLLNQDADWRWMSGRTDTPWYPSMRLFRQKQPDDWESVIAEVTAELVRTAAEFDPPAAPPVMLGDPGLKARDMGPASATSPRPVTQSRGWRPFGP